jgi:small subunit ribosomal protein S21
MKKYNKSDRGKFKDYDQRLAKKRKRHGKKMNALDGIEPYQVEVRNDNVQKAYKILERMLKKDRVLEEYKERRYFKKPSEKRNEHKRRTKRRIQKEVQRQKMLDKLNNN